MLALGIVASSWISVSRSLSTLLRGGCGGGPFGSGMKIQRCPSMTLLFALAWGGTAAAAAASASFWASLRPTLVILLLLILLPPPSPSSSPRTSCCSLRNRFRHMLAPMAVSLHFLFRLLFPQLRLSLAAPPSFALLRSWVCCGSASSSRQVLRSEPLRSPLSFPPLAAAGVAAAARWPLLRRRAVRGRCKLAWLNATEGCQGLTAMQGEDGCSRPPLALLLLSTLVALALAMVGGGGIFLFWEGIGFCSLRLRRHEEEEEEEEVVDEFSEEDEDDSEDSSFWCVGFRRASSAAPLAHNLQGRVCWGS